MNSITVSSFAEIQEQQETLKRVDDIFKASLERKNIASISSAIKAGANIFSPLGENSYGVVKIFECADGELLFLDAISHLPLITNISYKSEAQHELERNFKTTNNLALASSLAKKIQDEKANKSDEKILTLHFGSRIIELRDYQNPANRETFYKIEALIKSIMVLKEHYPKDPEECTYRKLWDINIKLLSACKEGNLSLAQEALTEGASLLVKDSKGKPGLISLIETADPIQAISLFIAFDPSLQLVCDNDKYILRITPNARRAKGATGEITSLYLNEDTTLRAAFSDFFNLKLQPEHVNERMRVHFLTLDRFKHQIKALQKDLIEKSLIPTGLRWPNLADYRRILQEGFQQSSNEIKEEEQHSLTQGETNA